MNSLTNLVIKDYAGIRTVDLIPSQVTVITGKNGSGKSAVRDAIHHLFTGEMARDVKVGQLVRQGGKTMEIVGTLESGTKIHRKRVKSGAETRTIDGQPLSSEEFQHAVASLVGTPIRAIGAALLTGHLFDLKLPELLRVMQDITGVEFDEDTIREKLGEGIINAALEVNIRTPTSLDDFVRAEKEAVETRKAGKRVRETREEDLNRLQVPAGAAAELANRIITKHEGDINVAREFARGQLGKLRAERDELLRKAASAAGKREGQLEILEQRVSALRDEKAGLESEIDFEALQADRTALAEMTQNLRKISLDRAEVVAEGKSTKAIVDGAKHSLTSLMSVEGEYHPAEIAEIDARIEVIRGHCVRDEAAAKAAQDAYENGGTSLPILSQTHKSMSPCPAFPEFKCPVSTQTFNELREKSKGSSKDLKKRLDDAREEALASQDALDELMTKRAHAEAYVRRQKLLCDIEKAEARLAELRQKSDTLKSLETQLSTDAERVRTDVSETDAKARRLESVKEEGKRLVAQLKALREQPSNDDDASTEQVPEYDTRIQRAESTLEVMDLLKRREEAMVAYKAADRQVTAADLLVGAFGPKGIKLKLINEATDPVVNVVNRSLSRLAPEYSVDIDVEGETPVRVTKGKGTVISPKALSRGEYLRVGYVFQYAIASLTGQKVVVFDDVDAIDAPGAVALASIVNGMCEEGVQIFLMTHGVVPPGLTNEARIYRLENGEIAATTGMDNMNVALGVTSMNNMPVENYESSERKEEVDLDDPF